MQRSTKASVSSRWNTGFLRLLAGIHLCSQQRRTIRLRHFLRQGTRKPFAVDGLNDIKHRYCLADLVGLQWAYKVQFNIVAFSLQFRPFLLGFLDAILPKDALSAKTAPRIYRPGKS